MLQLLHTMFADAGRAATILRLAVLIATIVVVTVTELRDARIPDWLVAAVVAAAIALAVATTVAPATMTGSAAGAAYTVVAAATGFAVAATVRVATAGGLGIGDVKLSTAIFALVGVRTAMNGHLYAAAIALAAIGIEAIRERDRTVCEAGFQFGPFIAAGVTIAYLVEIGWL